MAEIRPSLHVLCYGDSGSGKTTFAATFPKPMLVFAFDPRSKALPYLNQGTVEPEIVDPQGTPVRVVLNGKNRAIVQVEHYNDDTFDPAVLAARGQSYAYQRFLTRLSVLDWSEWATIVIDSVTFAELSVRKMNQYYLNPTTKEPRQWFGASTDALEEILMIRFGGYPGNLVTICHVDEDKDEVFGQFVRNPMAPGRLRKKLATAYGELYHMDVKVDQKGKIAYQLQTRPNASYNACSRINAPDPCAPSYRALWDGATTLTQGEGGK